MFVFFNLMLGAMLIVPLALSPNIFTFMFKAPSFLVMMLFPVLLIVFFNVLMVRQIRLNKRRLAPECPACGSEDVSFGGEVTDVTFYKSGLATRLAVLGSLGTLFTLPWVRNFLPSSPPLNVYIFAVPIIGLAIQIASQIMAARHRKRARERSDGRIRWVCETCKNKWEGLERPAESVPAAPAPLIR